MRSSTFLTILGAGLAIASPLLKRTIVTEVETDVVYIYVTETAPTATTSTDADTTVSSSMAGYLVIKLSDVSFPPLNLHIFCGQRSEPLANITS